MTDQGYGFEEYLELAETLWQADPNEIASTARVSGGVSDTKVVTDLLALKMDARDRARRHGEEAGIAELVVRLSRLPRTDLESYLEVLE